MQVCIKIDCLKNDQRLQITIVRIKEKKQNTFKDEIMIPAEHNISITIVQMMIFLKSVRITIIKILSINNHMCWRSKTSAARNLNF